MTNLSNYSSNSSLKAGRGSRPLPARDGGSLRRCGAMVLGAGALVRVLIHAPAPACAQQSTPAPAHAPVTVTLVTGDRVTVTGLDAGIEPGPGRERLGFISQRTSVAPGQPPHLFVIPEDAIPLLAADRVDRRLFDVTLLVEYGYDDARRADLPLIASYAPSVAAAVSVPSAAPIGAVLARVLPAINGVSIVSPKARTNELWGSLTAPRGASAPRGPMATQRALAGAPVDKLWLDGRLELLLDESVPRIGAPAAWALGLEGNGVRVAVIDSEVDVTHPDLVDAVVVTRDFITDPPEDETSHGTSVAAVIAGSGAASGGIYRGVAPGAQLLAAKACRRECAESSVIAGLHWAIAEEGAQVVNMSLGDSDAPGFDPVEEAVSTLAAQYGSLIVAAAGNSGPARRTIARPANLAVALTVGAVDRADRVAEGSSRGLTLGDHAIKPDLTAPTFVTTARAAGTLGGLDDEFYTTLGGTSGAAPHVTGAAALLIEQNPDWSAADVKAALMGSAAFNPADGVVDQGAGRVDVAAALATSFFPSSPSVSFGSLPWPHDDDGIVTRTLSFRNLGSAVGLLFEYELLGPDGTPAPDGMFSITPAAATLPEGGTISVRLTADARLAALDGVYGGRLIASDGAGRRIGIPVALERDVESYDLTVAHFNRQRSPTNEFLSTVISPDGSTRVIDGRGSPGSGEVTLRLPKREGYAIEAYIYDADEASPFSRIVAPNITLDQDMRLALDASLASPVRVVPPSADAEVIGLNDIWVLPTDAGNFTSRLGYSRVGDVPFYQAELDPRAPSLQSLLTVQWLDASEAPPALFAGAWLGHGRLPVGPVSIDRRQTTVMHSSYAAPKAPAPIDVRLSVGVDLDIAFAYTFPFRIVELPHRRSEYFFSDDPNVRWLTRLMMTDEQNQFFTLEQISAALEPARTYTARWNQPVFAPALPELSRSNWAYREGDQLVISVPLHADSEGHTGTITTTGSMSLYCNGELLERLALVQRAVFSVPPEPATYRLEIDSNQSMIELSPRQQLAWTFASGHATDAIVRLPLLAVRFTPELSEGGQAPAGTPFSVSVSVDQYGRESPPEVGVPSVEASYDDGTTWSTVPVDAVGARWNAHLDHPSDVAYVSLRASAGDAEGNRVELTVLRAYGLAPPQAP